MPRVSTPALSFRKTANPLSLGNPISRTITSGMSALAISRAASPSSAPITSYPFMARYSIYISRASVKSSTTRTRTRSVTESLALKYVIGQLIPLHRTLMARSGTLSCFELSSGLRPIEQSSAQTATQQNEEFDERRTRKRQIQNHLELSRLDARDLDEVSNQPVHRSGAFALGAEMLIRLFPFETEQVEKRPPALLRDPFVRRAALGPPGVVRQCPFLDHRGRAR